MKDYYVEENHHPWWVYSRERHYGPSGVPINSNKFICGFATQAQAEAYIKGIKDSNARS